MGTLNPCLELGPTLKKAPDAKSRDAGVAGYKLGQSKSIGRAPSSHHSRIEDWQLSGNGGL